MSKKTPILNKLITEGHIMVKEGEYIGRAQYPLGTVGTGQFLGLVALGIVGNETQLERYLRCYPTPDKW